MDDRDNFLIKTEKREYIIKAYNRPDAIQKFNMEKRHEVKDYSEFISASRQPNIIHKLDERIIGKRNL